MGVWSVQASTFTCWCEAGGEGGKSVLPAELLPNSKHSHTVEQAQCLYKTTFVIVKMSQGQ